VWHNAPVKKRLSVLLSLCLGLFLADAIVSLLDDTVILVSGVHALDLVRIILFLLAGATSLIVYVLIGITPMVPKRAFLPIVLFNGLELLAIIPVSIYHFDRLQQAAWLLSLIQVLVALAVLRWAQGGWVFRWPALPEEVLAERRFSLWNLSGFLSANVVAVPVVLIYLAICASLAVDHYSAGFLALHWNGLAARARTYVRADGKQIQLVPMMHIGEKEFYGQISASMPTNSVVLLEGVTDRQDLLQHKLNYRRMAASLGLTEQREVFGPGGAQSRHADVDIDQFSKETLSFLNTASLVHSQGFSLETLGEFFGKSQSPELMDRLWQDLLVKRNEHLLSEVRAELPRTQNVVVPWGAAHMPGLAREIQKSGFRLVESKQYYVIHFGRRS
jgi:hypothetical protein